jgi:hypothetical protein
MDNVQYVLHCKRPPKTELYSGASPYTAQLALKDDQSNSSLSLSPDLGLHLGVPLAPLHLLGVPADCEPLLPLNGALLSAHAPPAQLLLPTLAAHRNMALFLLIFRRLLRQEYFVLFSP